MDQPPNIPSEPPRPLSLTERLKAEANGHAPAEELTASFNSDGMGGRAKSCRRHRLQPGSSRPYARRPRPR